MPWCPDCDRFLSPPSVTSDGRCPTCGTAVEVGEAARRRAATTRDTTGERDLPPVPWHFKLLVGSLVVYLGYRAWQGVEWLRHALH